MFGVGSIAQVVLGKGKFGGILSINFGWAIGVMFGVYWSAGVSGELKHNFIFKFFALKHSYKSSSPLNRLRISQSLIPKHLYSYWS